LSTGRVRIPDEHYGSSRPGKPRRAPRARTAAEKQFLGLGEIAAQFVTGADPADRLGLRRTTAGRPVGDLWRAGEPAGDNFPGFGLGLM
jgi:hypothetical protein